MNLLLSSNNAYLSPMKTMLTSFCESNKEEHHNVHFLYGSVNEKSLAKIADFFEKQYDVSFIMHKINAEVFQQFPVSHHFSIETYYRFLVTDILPVEEDRVLWLDIDIIVKASLQSFYTQSFDGKMLVVCKSINTNSEILLDRLGCPSGTEYFNAGVILFNLTLIRQHYTIADFFNYFTSHSDKITWLDQDILNGMFALKTIVADYRIYNYQMFDQDQLSQTDLDHIEKNTAIIHYIGAVKPWHTGYRNPCKKYWNRYVSIYRKKKNLLLYYLLPSQLLSFLRSAANYIRRVFRFVFRKLSRKRISK